MVRWRFLIWSLSFWDLLREKIFSVNLYKKIGSVCFSDSFVQKNVSKQMATVMIQATPSFYANFPKNSLFDTAKTYGPYFVLNDYFIVNH